MNKIYSVYTSRPKTFSLYSSYIYSNSGDFIDANNNFNANSVFVNSSANLNKKSDSVYGKVWITNKNIDKGCHLFSRHCLMVFPRLPSSFERTQADIPDEDKDVNICLGCCQMTKSLCTLCGWPLHRFQCRQWAAEQHMEECLIFRKYRIDFEDYRNSPHVYDLIAILRMCLLKRKKENKVMWSNLLRLRIRCPAIGFRYGSLMKNFILGSCKLIGIADKEINSLMGILEANRFSVQIMESYPKSIFASFLLLKTSEDFGVEIFPLPHSCVPNTEMVYSKLSIDFVASENIKMGDMLTMNYLNIPGAFLWLSKSDRRLYLKKRHYEKPCPCDMCKVNLSSKIELSTNNEDEFCLSRALKCHNCTYGHMVLNNFQTKWKCKNRNCTAFLSKKEGLEIEIKAEKQLFSKGKLEMSDIMKKISLSQIQLHPCHRILHRKALEVFRNISDTLLYLIVNEHLSKLSTTPDIIASIRDLCRHIFQVEFELSKKSNEPSFALALSMVIGTYLELLTAEEVLQTDAYIGNLSRMITEMTHRIYMGLRCLWNTYLTEGFESEFCLRLSNSCYRRLKSVKSKLSARNSLP